MKPQLFIGCSVEGLPIAQAIQLNLVHQVDVTIWDQGFFRLTKSTLSNLVDNIDNYDFAIFVLSADDIIQMRDLESFVARDNVIFELGLFIGRLGAEYTYFVVPNDADIHLPSDLLGIKPATYETNSHMGNINAALGAACSEIRNAISSLTTNKINLSGNWRLNWIVASENYDTENISTVKIIQTGNKVKYTLTDRHNIKYPVRGEIFRNSYIQGVWGNPNENGTYFGSLQLYIHPTRKKIIGKWIGFKSNNQIDCDDFILEKI